MTHRRKIPSEHQTADLVRRAIYHLARAQHTHDRQAGAKIDLALRMLDDVLRAYVISQQPPRPPALPDEPGATLR